MLCLSLSIYICIQLNIASDVEENKTMKMFRYELSNELSLQESTGTLRLPSSYLLELIVFGEWERAGSLNDFDLRKGFYHVLTAVANYSKLKLAWTRNYTSHHCRYLNG